jgi:hypothetical protein
MTVPVHKKAFTACAAMLAVAVALIAALSPRPRNDRPARVTEPRPLVLASADVPNSGTRQRGSVGAEADEGRESLAAARRSARSFVRAFIRYQLGDASARTRARIASTASGAVERYLVAAPARALGERRHPELRSLRLYARSRTEAKASALLRYRRMRSLFEFLLEQRQGDWRVVELYP